MSMRNAEECEEFLSLVNYYRFSGYFRYWQVTPTCGNNRFQRDTSFEVIRNLYLAEQDLADEILRKIRRIEVVLRTKFSHIYAREVIPAGGLTEGIGLSQPTNLASIPAKEYVLQDLNRSKETFVDHYRDDKLKNSRGQFLPQAYKDMPTWVAVEALSFGTLSRCIQASSKSGVLAALAEELNLSRTFVPSQVKSFVYLRNRIAHNARIWNHSVVDAPGLPPKIKHRATRSYGMFEPRSVYTVLLALDRMLASAKIEHDWLASLINPLLAGNSLLERGIKIPRKYGEMDLSL